MMCVCGHKHYLDWICSDEKCNCFQLREDTYLIPTSVLRMVADADSMFREEIERRVNEM
jgi:hypothetical protein